MGSDRHDRLKQVYFAALDLSSAELEAFLAAACPQEPELAEEVRSLIAADRAAGDTFMERPAMRVLGLTTAADAEPETPHRSAPVTDWDRYTDLELIASGGMGDVYRAFDPRLKRHTALKFIRGASAKHVGRFLREAEAQARVEHANVLEVYETGEVDGQLYIAMRFIAGPTLKETREETTVEQKTVIMRQVAEAIHAAHREGLVHRDIKPTNILIERTADGILKPWVTDFGIVADDRSPALTATGDLVGTPWYMAPERLTGDEATVDRRSDIFSLGVTLFEYLSGQRPYSTDNAVELFSQVREGQPRRLRQVAPELPEDLETIVMKCLEHEPERRYQSARDLADDLGRFLDGETISARRPSLAYTTWSWVRRNRAVAAISVAALLLLAALAVVDVLARREARAREALERELNHQVEEIDNIMRLARVAPTHDLASDKALAFEGVTAISARLEEAGPLGEGPGHYALGRAYLALGEYRRAREHLERALNLGHDGRAVSAAVGQALAALYFEAVQEAERIADDGQRQQARERARAELRGPALAHLRKAGPVGGTNPELTQALIAFLEQRSADALEWTRKASAKLPWLYEARKLEGDIHAEAGFASWRNGNEAAARHSWEQAVAAYRQAATVARSDRGSLLGMCRIGQRLMELEADHSHEQMAQSFDLALAACDQARMIDPTRADVLRWTSDLYFQRSLAALRHGEPPGRFIEKAVRAASDALALKPLDDGALLARGNALLAEARLERSLGSDPSTSLDEAIAAYDRALAVNRRSLQALLNQGLALLERAAAASAAGADPTVFLTRSVAILGEAVAVQPDDLHGLADLAAAHRALAERAVATGRDPAADLAAADELLQRTVRANPRFASGHAGLGACSLLAARRIRATGGAPQAELDAAATAFALAVELDPTLAEAWAGRAEVQAMAAAAASGRNATALARAGLEAAERALALDPGLEEAKRARATLAGLVGAG